MVFIPLICFPENIVRMAFQERYRTVRTDTVPGSTERKQSYCDAREDRTMYFLYPKDKHLCFQGLRLFLTFIPHSKRMHYFEKVEIINVSE